MNAASVIMRLGVATTILVGAELILSGRIDFMLLFLFLLVITRIYAPFDQSLALIAEMFVSQVSADRMMEISGHARCRRCGRAFSALRDTTLYLSMWSFAYDEKKVLHDVSFTAKEGEVTALVGPSGSGKSTCARLAARLWDVTEGAVKVGGVDISTVDPEVLLTDYSMVFQDVVLFDDTVMENIRLGRRGATDEEVLAAARAANCDEFVRKLPQGLRYPHRGKRRQVSPAASGSASLSPGRCSRTRPSCCWTRRPPAWTWKTKPRCRGRSPACWPARRCWSSPTGCAPWPEPTISWCWKTAAWRSRARPRELMAEGGLYRRMVELQQESAQWRLA